MKASTTLRYECALTESRPMRLVAGPQNRPVDGVVTAVSASGVRCEEKVGADGHFLMSVNPGVYRVSGHSPKFNAGTTRCDADRSVNVTPVPIDYRGPPQLVTVECQGF
jgi:hypothetical protein